MLTIKTHLKSLVTSSLYLSNVGTLVVRTLRLRARPIPAHEPSAMDCRGLAEGQLANDGLGGGTGLVV